MKTTIVSPLKKAPTNASLVQKAAICADAAQ